MMEAITQDYKPLLYNEFINSIYDIYKSGNDNCIPQGKCGHIATHIQSIIGGKVCAGYLVFNHGKREHWWVETDTHIIDPMARDWMATDPCRHEFVHSDISKAYWLNNEKQ